MSFRRKMAIFPRFFFRKYRPAKYLLRYSREKKTPFSAIKTRSQKSRKINIFPQSLTHDFGQKWPFLQPFFLGNIGQETVFYDILEWKKAFLAYKNKKFERSKNWHFSKGFFFHGYGPQMAIFQLFFRKYRPEKCLLRYSRVGKFLSRL